MAKGDLRVSYLQGLYLVLAAGVVIYVYRSSLKALFQKGNPLLLLSRPVVVLTMAYIGGMNVPAIVESFSSVIPPSISEPFFYLATLIAVWGLSLLPFLRPIQGDSKKPM